MSINITVDSQSLAVNSSNVQNSFILVRFLKNQIRFGMSLVRFGKTQFGLNSIVIYYSCNS